MSAEAELLCACYGNAEPGDRHLLAEVVAVDGGIVRVIERRERRRQQRQKAEELACS
jgi:hypothetical protein